jgi:hypothetical protein
MARGECFRGQPTTSSATPHGTPLPAAIPGTCPMITRQTASARSASVISAHTAEEIISKHSLCLIY